ncbi:hypothetical protein ALQ00_102466 [Pseudomonas syringae pv. tomato]|nr:hypothetical protein ALQ00_102466 [Pseudomonas syringae pv. tomato]
MLQVAADTAKAEYLNIKIFEIGQSTRDKGVFAFKISQGALLKHSGINQIPRGDDDG